MQEEDVFTPYPELKKGAFTCSREAKQLTALEAQNRLITSIPNSTVGRVNVSNNNYINTLLIDNSDSSTEKGKNLVIAHGFGAGLAFFHRNYKDLSSNLKGWKIFGIDWLGMANSSRPKFPKWDEKLSEVENVRVAESFFIDSLEEWREKQQLERLTLVGHSLGGYLSVAYCEKYPSRVEKLILVSPAGVGDRPSEESIRERARSSWFYSLAFSIWNNGFTPQGIVRNLPYFGSNFIKNYTERRFRHLPEEELIDFHDYFHHITTQKGSGEYSLGSLLVPGAAARLPLNNRLAQLNIPTSFFYGDDDWMDFKAAVKTGAKMKAPTRVALIANAGHHLYSDNPTPFNLGLLGEVLNQKPIQHNDLEYVWLSSSARSI